MKTTEKIMKRLSAVLLGTFITFSSFLAIPQVAHASACDRATGGGGGGALFNVSAKALVPDTALKVGTEITPVSTWGSLSSAYSYVQFAKSDCTTANAGASISLHNLALTVSVYDNNHSTAYVPGTDFTNGAPGVSYGHSGNFSQSLTYSLPSMPTSTAQLISYDISSPGKLSIYLKQGSGTDTLLGDVTLDSSAVKFANMNGAGTEVAFDAQNYNWTSCSQVNSGAEAQGRVLIDGVATDLTMVKASICTSLDKSTYDSPSKTIDFNFIKASDATGPVEATILPPAVDDVKEIATNLYSGLTTANGYFSDGFNVSTSGSQAVYFMHHYGKDTNGFTAQSTIPIAGGTFDLSKGDIDTSAAVLDTSMTDHKAVAHGVAQLTTDKTFTLFVPYKDGDNYVGVCPGAASLADVSSKCTSIHYYKDGETTNGVHAQIVTINGAKYWQVSGLTGTGAFSTTASGDPNTGYGSITNPVILIGLAGGTVVLAVGARRLSAQKNSAKR